MVVHLFVNASILNSDASFQKGVYSIHSLGRLLPIVEWVFIFIPIIFHGVFGLVIMSGAAWNTSTYSNSSNVRYTLQRISGMVAFVFIFMHVLHLHGWIHYEPILSAVKSANGAQFRPFNAASSLHLAMAGFVIPVLYFIGLLACVFHFANGIWTMGITWGAWTSPAGQMRASWVCMAIGIVLMAAGSGAIVGVKKVDLNQALKNEKNAAAVRASTGEITEQELHHKSFSESELEAVKEAASKQKAGNDHGKDNQEVAAN